MADLETDLRRGGLNWVDSGGTYDPYQEGPEWAFGPWYGQRNNGEPTEMPRSRISQAIQWVGSLFLIGFVLTALFLLEPLTAIFYR